MNKSVHFDVSVRGQPPDRPPVRPPRPARRTEPRAGLTGRYHCHRHFRDRPTSRRFRAPERRRRSAPPLPRLRCCSPTRASRAAAPPASSRPEAVHRGVARRGAAPPSVTCPRRREASPRRGSGGARLRLPHAQPGLEQARASVVVAHTGGADLECEAVLERARGFSRGGRGAGSCRARSRGAAALPQISVLVGGPPNALASPAAPAAPARLCPARVP
jgi:hypothetical protein